MSEQKKLFLRDATGLVRAWSLYDSFVYSALSINIVTLAWFIFPSASFQPQGNLITAMVISAIFIFFLIVTYTLLISIMPRAGGDYVWQSRILSGSVGTILAFTGYVFILWQWGAIYSAVLSYEIASPIAAVLGNASAAIWWSSANGIFTSSILTIILVSIFISLGMKVYARIQKWSFHIGMLGLIVVIVILATSSQSAFQSAFESFTTQVFGASPGAYQSTISLAQSGGLTGMAGLTDWNLIPSLGLIPVVVYWLVYPVWGATLYGEVKGSNDFKKNLRALTISLVFSTLLAILVLVLFANAFGWNFYNSINYLYYCFCVPSGSSVALPIFPYPALLAGLITHNTVVELFILVTMSFWYWGWSGTLFITSTRVLFAASFDRILPAAFADVNERLHSPVNALIAMAVPTAIFCYLYSYVTVGGLSFSTFVLDAAVVIVVMYVGTAIAAAVLPYRRKDLYESSPITSYKVGGIPLITVAGIITALFLGAVLAASAINPVYGVNNPYSAGYVLILYAIAIVLYFGFKAYRKKQGFDMGRIYKQIPVE